MLRKHLLLQLCFLIASLSALTHAAEFDAQYTNGDVIDPGIFVTDTTGSQVNLASLISKSDSGLSVLFIFGGGDMGMGMPGHLWCPDSFEDTHILRTLHGKYASQGVNFIAVAAAPVYHTQMLGHEAGVFFTQAPVSEGFNKAQQAFAQSTRASFESGILPVEPYLDTGFRLMFNRTPELMPGENYGEVFSWQGVFRDPGETQFYGVPSFWIVDSEGKILAEPFRGNIYHPHGAEVSIKYTFSDIDQVLQTLL